ncbi:hypothetical protein E2C01_010994 [Portunus trituberculatus]|uniref:Uncharacterized protein n=1 Tax=Portunus trituberculatus TaxID=210409 RepID=A0A5B7D9U4_PORTR|nr:hypothetical protein [Portunus trituberculatus]
MRERRAENSTHPPMNTRGPSSGVHISSSRLEAADVKLSGLLAPGSSSSWPPSPPPLSLLSEVFAAPWDIVNPSFTPIVALTTISSSSSPSSWVKERCRTTGSHCFPCSAFCK